MTTEEFVLYMIKWGNYKARCKSNFAKTDEAKKNEELRDKYKNQRCFILGNGKSLNQQDLSLLSNEIVFVTNSFCRYKGYQTVRPDYYLLMDPSYFRNRIGEKLVEGISGLQDYEHKPAFIFPVSAKKIIHEKYKWDEWADVYYIDAPMSFVADYAKPWDITKPVPAPQCVVQTAMLLATFMGFREIYLLGVEQTNIFDTINAYLGKNAENYVYENAEGNSTFIESVNQVPVEDNLRGYARIFQLYKEVYNYCVRQGIEVFNCTPETLITSIPKKDFKAIFDK